MPYRIDVNIKLLTLILYKDNKFVKSYRIAVGKMVTPTPKGHYKIINKQYRPGGPFGVLWMGLSKPHYGIHGTNQPNSIGKKVSHGCIRMRNSDVLNLSSYVSIGTPVYIHEK